MTDIEPDRTPRHLAYRATRENITDLAAGAAAMANTTIPSCPEWTVYDLVAHVAGHCLGRVGETVADSRGELDALLDAWRRAAAVVEPNIADGTDDAAMLLMDTFTHELDLRAALGAPAPADHPAYPWAFDVVVGGLAWSIELRRLPAIRLVCEEGPTWVAGPGRPAVSVRARRYDLYRSLTGRRSPAQIGELAWSDDPGPWREAFFWGPFRPPAQAGD
jgi:hypothetical protein